MYAQALSLVNIDFCKFFIIFWIRGTQKIIIKLKAITIEIMSKFNTKLQ